MRLFARCSCETVIFVKIVRMTARSPNLFAFTVKNTHVNQKHATSQKQKPHQKAIAKKQNKPMHESYGLLATTLFSYRPSELLPIIPFLPLTFRVPICPRRLRCAVVAPQKRAF